MDKLTTSRVAERLNVGQSTVNLWCRKGVFPNAEFTQTPQGGYWQIPEGDLDNFVPPKVGRPRKVQSEKPARRTGKKKEGRE